MHGQRSEALAAQLQDVVDIFGSYGGEHLIVDEQGRPLVAHAGAARPFERELAVPRGLPERDPEVALQLAGHAVLAGHIARDRAAQADHELAVVPLVEKGVEGHDAVDLHRVDVEMIGDHLHRELGDLVVLRLDLLQDRDERGAPRAKACDPGGDVLPETLSIGYQHGVTSPLSRAARRPRAPGSRGRSASPGNRPRSVPLASPAPFTASGAVGPAAASGRSGPWTHGEHHIRHVNTCLLYTSPSPRDRTRSRMP